MSKKQNVEERIERALEDFVAFRGSWLRDDRGMSSVWLLNGNRHTYTEMCAKVNQKRKKIAAKIMKITSEAQP